jgi:hypothetical protein
MVLRYTNNIGIMHQYKKIYTSKNWVLFYIIFLFYNFSKVTIHVREVLLTVSTVGKKTKNTVA